MTTTNNTPVNLTELQLFCVLESPLTEGAFLNKINSKQLMKTQTKMLHNLHAWFWTVLNNNNNNNKKCPEKTLADAESTAAGTPTVGIKEVLEVVHAYVSGCVTGCWGDRFCHHNSSTTFQQW